MGQAMGTGRRWDTADLVTLIADLQRDLLPARDDAERIERVGHLETLKAVLGAVQLAEAVASGS